MALLLAGIAPPAAAALDPDKRFHHYVKDDWSLRQGLPQITVLALAQCAEAYIWVATQQGVASFDGVRFRVHTPDNTPELDGGYIYALLADSRGRLWIGSYKGVTLHRDRAFHAVAGPGGSGNTAEVTVRAIAENPDGDILVATDEGLFTVVDESRLEAYPMPRPGPVAALHTEDGGVWVGGLGRFWWRGGDGDREWSLPEGYGTAQVTGFARHDNRLWVATSSGLFRFEDGELHAFVPEPWLAEQPIEAIYADSLDTLWVGTDPALLRIRGGRLAESIGHEHPNAHRQIQSILEDHEGNLWFGSYRDGLARYWSGWTERYSKPEGLHESLVWSVADAGDGAVWVGTNDGLSRFDGEHFELVVPGSRLPHPHAYTLRPEPGRLWIGTRRGIAILNLETGELERPVALRALDPYQINGIIPSGREGEYLFPTNNGLYRLEAGELHRASDTMGTRMVRFVHREPDGRKLVATDNGMFESSEEDYRRLDAALGLPLLIDYASILRIDEELLLVASIDSGLWISAGGAFRPLSVDQGLPSNASYSTEVGDDGYLWVGGFHGLYRVPIEQLRAYARGSRDRVDGQMILSESGRHLGSQRAYCCNGAGHAKSLMRADGLWLPTRGGVVRA
jgi:ligand-binding sensor domain-containing protein